jgi:hypothetical protein
MVCKISQDASMLTRTPILIIIIKKHKDLYFYLSWGFDQASIGENIYSNFIKLDHVIFLKLVWWD